MTIPNDFPWRTGMRGICERSSVGFRVVDVAGGALLIVWEDRVAIGRLLGSVATIDPATVEPDLTDPATLGALLGAVREVYDEPTLHPRPVLLDTLTSTDPQVVWYIERAKEDDHEWLRTNGMWGEMADGHKAPAISTDTEAAALLSAWAARQVRS